MAATIAGLTLSTAKVVSKANSPKNQTIKSSCLNHPWPLKANHFRNGRMYFRTMATKPEISEIVTESIKNAEEVCAGDPKSGECAAAWDEVEEVSAAASHARLRKKELDSDPLENYCKDNPETVECRTYED